MAKLTVAKPRTNKLSLKNPNIKASADNVLLSMNKTKNTTSTDKNSTLGGNKSSVFGNENEEWEAGDEFESAALVEAETAHTDSAAALDISQSSNLLTEDDIRKSNRAQKVWSQKEYDPTQLNPVCLPEGNVSTNNVMDIAVELNSHLIGKVPDKDDKYKFQAEIKYVNQFPSLDDLAETDKKSLLANSVPPTGGQPTSTVTKSAKIDPKSSQDSMVVNPNDSPPVVTLQKNSDPAVTDDELESSIIALRLHFKTSYNITVQAKIDQALVEQKYIERVKISG